MSEVRGPFGLWRFPLLNLLRQMLSQTRTMLSQKRPALPNVGAVKGDASTDRVTQNNVESWELVRDEKGRLANVVVHRKVTENERKFFPRLQDVRSKRALNSIRESDDEETA